MSQGLRIAPPEAPVVSFLNVCKRVCFQRRSPFNFYYICNFLSDGLHVWQRCVLCRYGVQECKLLSHLPVRTCRPPAAGWGCPRQYVSHIIMKKTVNVLIWINNKQLSFLIGMNWKRPHTLQNYPKENTVLKVRSCLLLEYYAVIIIKLLTELRNSEISSDLKCL